MVELQRLSEELVFSGATIKCGSIVAMNRNEGQSQPSSFQTGELDHKRNQS